MGRIAVTAAKRVKVVSAFGAFDPQDVDRRNVFGVGLKQNFLLLVHAANNQLLETKLAMNISVQVQGQRELSLVYLQSISNRVDFLIIQLAHQRSDNFANRHLMNLFDARRVNTMVARHRSDAAL